MKMPSFLARSYNKRIIAERFFDSQPSMILNGLFIASSLLIVECLILAICYLSGLPCVTLAHDVEAKRHITIGHAVVLMIFLIPLLDTIGILMIHIIIQKYFGFWYFIVALVLLSSAGQYMVASYLVPYSAVLFLILGGQYDVWRKQRGGFLAFGGVAITHAILDVMVSVLSFGLAVADYN